MKYWFEINACTTLIRFRNHAKFSPFSKYFIVYKIIYTLFYAQNTTICWFRTIKLTFEVTLIGNQNLLSSKESDVGTFQRLACVLRFRHRWCRKQILLRNYNESFFLCLQCGGLRYIIIITICIQYSKQTFS